MTSKYKSGHYWVSYDGEVQIAWHDGYDNWYLCGNEDSYFNLTVLSKEPIEPPNFD